MYAIVVVITFPSAQSETRHRYLRPHSGYNVDVVIFGPAHFHVREAYKLAEQIPVVFKARYEIISAVIVLFFFHNFSQRVNNRFHFLRKIILFHTAVPFKKWLNRPGVPGGYP
jgi:hypothetical protein